MWNKPASSSSLTIQILEWNKSAVKNEKRKELQITIHFTKEGTEGEIYIVQFPLSFTFYIRFLARLPKSHFLLGEMKDNYSHIHASLFSLYMYVEKSKFK